MNLSPRATAPLSRRLLLLACAGIVPLALMSGIGLRVLAQQRRVQTEHVGLELARAVATAVDAELRSTIARSSNRSQPPSSSTATTCRPSASERGACSAHNPSGPR